MADAATEFANDVATGHFPTSQQSFN